MAKETLLTSFSFRASPTSTDQTADIKVIDFCASDVADANKQVEDNETEAAALAKWIVASLTGHCHEVIIAELQRHRETIDVLKR